MFSQHETHNETWHDCHCTLFSSLKLSTSTTKAHVVNCSRRKRFFVSLLWFFSLLSTMWTIYDPHDASTSISRKWVKLFRRKEASTCHTLTLNTMNSRLIEGIIVDSQASLTLHRDIKRWDLTRLNLLSGLICIWMITKSPEYFEVMKNIDFVAPQKERKPIEKNRWRLPAFFRTSSD